MWCFSFFFFFFLFFTVYTSWCYIKSHLVFNVDFNTLQCNNVFLIWDNYSFSEQLLCISDIPVLCLTMIFIYTVVLLKQQVSYSGTFGYTNPEMEVEDPTAMSSQDGSAWVLPARLIKHDSILKKYHPKVFLYLFDYIVC